MRILILLASCMLALFSSQAMGQSFKDASEARLPNGLKVIMLENRKAPIVSFQVWYRAGSRNERVGRTGLAHVLEHMMFKGTKRVSGEEFARMLDETGGEDNAFTSHDFAAYFENLASDRIGIAIELEADRMQNLVLKEEDFQTERMVVVEERRMRVDDKPQSFLVEQLEAAAYQSQPYHWPVIGWTGDLARLTIEDVQDFYAEFYNPANAFIVVTGDFEKESLLRELEKTFGKIPARKTSPQPYIEDPPQSGERRIVVERPAQVGTIAAAYHVPNLRDRDSYVLEVIDSILSGGKSSRIYDRLVRGQIALEASTDYSLTSRDPGLFYLAASFLPGKDMDEIEKALYDELEKLKTTPVEAKELEKAKNQLESAFLLNQDSLFSLGLQLADYEIAHGWKAIADYLPSIQSVTPEEIQRVASKYFTPANRTVGRLIPAGPAENAPAPTPGGLKDRMIRLLDKPLH
ncbi:MAG: insulinase family protein [Desulfobacteraceae bacterium]|nr:insulinase family protein [Desulfobacteraceae bacterium]